MDKIWANSGDSHFVEPENLWSSNLPKKLADLVPRSVKDKDGLWETVHVDGQTFRRRLPNIRAKEFHEAVSKRAPGANEPHLRLKDLDEEGIWSEVVFPSLGMWAASFRTPELLHETAKVSNDWAKSEIMDRSERFLPTAQVSTLVIEDAIAELHRTAAMGFRSIFMPVIPHPLQKDYNDEVWEPFWTAAEEAQMVIAFHIGTEPIDMSTGGAAGVYYRGLGGAVLNYTETSFGGQRAVMKMVASGALDRHPRLKVLVSEGGATWVPFIADRMEEGYRQHAMAVRPKLNRSPREIMFDQVYASFQHDASAVAAAASMGYDNVMWGSDYPHLEGTYGHTQATLHHLFDTVDPALQHRVTIGSFLELFPGATAPPEAAPVPA